MKEYSQACDIAVSLQENKCEVKMQWSKRIQAKTAVLLDHLVPIFVNQPRFYYLLCAHEKTLFTCVADWKP